MFATLMSINHILSGWLKNPNAPICELSLNYGEKRRRPYTVEEIRAMRETMKRYAPRCYITLFYTEGPIVRWASDWPHPFREKGLYCSLKHKVGGTAKVPLPEGSHDE
jgi:hypothetical protein